jgi:hypothetical protein
MCTMNLAEALNLHCACRTLQPELLTDALPADLAETRPHLFSASPVFLSDADAAAIGRAVQSLHRVTALPGWQTAVLHRAHGIASLDHGPSGAFMGYDFHIGPQGPRLIEINTNAGGGYLHAAALAAHRGCCDSMDALFNLPQDFEHAVLAMFQAEWRAARGDAPLRSVAIVDDAPALQYLAPEFELARQLFARHGITAVVADPAELNWRDGRLWHGELAIDLVYNRLTDFYLQEEAHAAVRAAYEHSAAVVTPHPRAHALHADKRNLITLSDDAALAAMGAAESDRAVLREVVPVTQLVTADNADTLWAQRRQLFFKPAGGYGSKAAYRGDKLTKRVWDEIRGGGFVAQALVPPSERTIPLNDGTTTLRLDVRAYAYRGEVLMLAARTYSGQTTNFRTPGGGFAAVAVLPALQTFNDCECPA